MWLLLSLPQRKAGFHFLVRHLTAKTAILHKADAGAEKPVLATVATVSHLCISWAYVAIRTITTRLLISSSFQQMAL